MTRDQTRGWDDVISKMEMRTACSCLNSMGKGLCRSKYQPKGDETDVQEKDVSGENGLRLATPDW